MKFPGHEQAIEILSRAEKELTALGYEVDFTKLFTKEENLPAYSNTHFSLKLTAGKWEYPPRGLETREE
jgi:hypothetical protein